MRGGISASLHGHLWCDLCCAVVRRQCLYGALSNHNLAAQTAACGYIYTGLGGGDAAVCRRGHYASVERVQADGGPLAALSPTIVTVRPLTANAARAASALADDMAFTTSMSL